MTKMRLWLALVLSVVATLASGSLEEEYTSTSTDCMSTLVGLSGVESANGVVSALRSERVGQNHVYDLAGFVDVDFFLKSIGVVQKVDRLILFKCLNKVSAVNGLICHTQSPCGPGLCNFVNGTHSCKCPPGFAGLHCQRELNECDLLHPCLNGGTCHDHVNNFTCSCLEGFYGRRCETDRNECASSPCRHGSCIDVINGFQCDCEAGYTGKVCDEDLDECASYPCKHGTCRDHLNKYSCDCQAGYKGYNCDVEIDECSSQPCQNQATCNDKVNSFTCQCPLGYDGRLCGNQWLTKNVLTNIRGSVSELQDKIGSAGTAAYTRWGRTVCPDSATLVYSGYVLGSHPGHNGGGASPLCVHSSPHYARYADHQWGAVLYGAVYETQGQSKPYSSSFQGKLAPCVVCAARQKTTTVIIPARNDCPADWNLEYHGYLLASHFNTDKRSQHLCFDDAIEAVSQHSPSSPHKLYRVSVSEFTAVYPQSRELTCAVCSK